ncbi:3-keto-disaccharide hydrolase [Aeoliella mucimassa]|uniref:3-keto-alpha-glucoside-1,2-lyase/3-keto-2-hydroxy-glucal hydratase domain-containing protein n=1 Tax=Aeoliella mucimassa TaxID=2527972 RepID=A0A518AK09_9BACT|nr:DUF1080 domain-containing protein [Aeoliella mucimassa]QDU55026.1 hypothetical protein Pan181_12120 [Aeoliella mucimassa]
MFNKALLDYPFHDDSICFIFPMLSHIHSQVRLEAHPRLKSNITMMPLKTTIAFLLSLALVIVAQGEERGQPSTSSTTKPLTDDSEVILIGSQGLIGFEEVNESLVQCGDARIAPDGKYLITTPGSGVLTAAKKESGNLYTKQSFGDCEVHVEFMMGKGSNSGVKLQSRYEIQLYDSHNIENPTAKHCGGVYPHWVYRKNGKGLNYIDEGVPPRANAAKPAGEWQSLDIVFRAPRFSADGKKVQNARFDSVKLNGVIVQQDVELSSPTGNAQDPLPEIAEAPLFLQTDHGAVAFRNARVSPLAVDTLDSGE